MTTNYEPTFGIDPKLTRETAEEWASRRWGVQATTKLTQHPNPIARIEVNFRGRKFVGCGYGYSNPQQESRSIWWKAAVDLQAQEVNAHKDT